MSRHMTFRDIDRELTHKENSFICKLIKSAIDATDSTGKTTNQIFGEIYTRFRADISMQNEHSILKKLFRSRLKALNGTEVGDAFNDIVNEIYQNKNKNQEAFLDLELCTVVAESCLNDAKLINEKARNIGKKP